jgi:hypothetical protein
VRFIMRASSEPVIFEKRELGTFGIEVVGARELCVGGDKVGLGAAQSSI